MLPSFVVFQLNANLFKFLNLLCGLIKDLYTDFRGSLKTTNCMHTVWGINVKVHGGGASF